MAIQKSGGVRRQRVLAALLHQESHHGQKIAEHAGALFRGLDARGNRAQGLVAVGDGGKQIQIDGATQSDAALVGLQGVEYDARRHSLCCGEDDIRPSSHPADHQCMRTPPRMPRDSA